MGSASFTVCGLCWQMWYSRTPLGKKRTRAAKAVEEEGEAGKVKDKKGRGLREEDKKSKRKGSK